jgi:hypothetical protein
MGLLKKLGLKKKKKDATTLVIMGCAQSKTPAAVVVGGAASLSGESNAKRDVSFSKVGMCLNGLNVWSFCLLHRDDRQVKHRHRGVSRLPYPRKRP